MKTIYIKILMLVSLMAVALPASADLFYIAPGEGGKCELSPQAQRKQIGPEQAQKISYGQTVEFTEYDAKNRAFLLGEAGCDGKDCWTKEIDVLKIMGNNDCSSKYVYITFDGYNIGGVDEDEWFVEYGDEVSPQEAALTLNRFKVDVQNQCDYLNKTKQGQSKIALNNESNVTRKKVTLKTYGICYIAD